MKQPKSVRSNKLLSCFGCRAMSLCPSPSTVPQSVGTLKPSALTPPSPNEVTEFSESSRLPLISVLATQEEGSPSLSLPPPPCRALLWVRGRMQVVFLWRASNPFGSQLSTLTGPESKGRLGRTSSTSPRDIFSHWLRFSLQGTRVRLWTNWRK